MSKTNKRQPGRPKIIDSVKLPMILNRATCADLFGHSPQWFDHYLTTPEGSPLIESIRVVNGRRHWLAEAVIGHVEGLK